MNVFAVSILHITYSYFEPNSNISYDIGEYVVEMAIRPSMSIPPKMSIVHRFVTPKAIETRTYKREKATDVISFINFLPRQNFKSNCQG